MWKGVLCRSGSQNLILRIIQIFSILSNPKPENNLYQVKSFTTLGKLSLTEKKEVYMKVLKIMGVHKQLNTLILTLTDIRNAGGFVMGDK